MPDGPKISAETLEKDGFGDETFFRCFVAELNQKVRQKNILNLQSISLYFSQIQKLFSSWDSHCITSPTPHGRGGRSTWRTFTSSRTSEAGAQEARLVELCRLALKLNHLTAVEGRGPRCIGHRMFSVQFLSPGLESAQH